MDLQWKWDKWTNAVISGNELIGATLHMRSEPMGSIEYCPNTIDPPLHHQLKTLFVDYLENHPTDGLITEWLQSFGPLYVTQFFSATLRIRKASSVFPKSLTGWAE